MVSPGIMEPTLKYHPPVSFRLTRKNPGTVHDGRFDWGGRLPKSNGGFQRSARHAW